MDRLHEPPGAGAVLPGVFRHPQDKLSRFGEAKVSTPGEKKVTFQDVAGADEEKKKIISEIFRRLAVDVKDELVKAAGAGVRRAGETILATGQAIADLRK